MLPRRHKNSAKAQEGRRKVCRICGGIFEKPTTISWRQWDMRVACGISCGQTKPLKERILERVIKTNSCWEWTGPKDKDGYGMLAVIENGRRVTRRAHRLSFREWSGNLPPQLFVLHSCDNPSCVNPDHLRLGTPQDNANDKMARGRHRNQYGSCHVAP